MNPTRSLIAVILLAASASGQKKKIDPHALATSNGIVYNPDYNPSPVWQQWVDKDGIYHAEFSDTENKWRCRVTSESPDFMAATIVCSKDTEPENRK